MSVGMKVTLWLAAPELGDENCDEKTKVPGTLPLPPVRTDEPSC